MRSALLVAFAIWSNICSAQLAEEGSYIVIRGAVKECEDWSSRILDVVQVGDKDTITLVGIPNVFVKQINQNQI